MSAGLRWLSREARLSIKDARLSFGFKVSSFEFGGSKKSEQVSGLKPGFRHVGQPPHFFDDLSYLLVKSSRFTICSQ